MCDVNISFGDCTNMAKMHGSWLCLLWSRRKAETTVEDDENCVVCVESQWNITFSSLYRAELKSTHLKLRNPHIFVVLKQFCSVFLCSLTCFEEVNPSNIPKRLNFENGMSWKWFGCIEVVVLGARWLQKCFRS